jgi:hypothetical protein
MARFSAFMYCARALMLLMLFMLFKSDQLGSWDALLWAELLPPGLERCALCCWGLLDAAAAAAAAALDLAAF